MPDLEKLLSMAEDIAVQAHEGQVRKDGQPYVDHVFRVAKAVRYLPSLEVIAFLHDVVEDTTVTLKDLQEQFPDWVTEAVRALTHKKREPYFEYIRRLSQNQYAVEVKLADLEDNLTDGGAPRLHESSAKKDLRTKYLIAHAMLMNRSRGRVPYE